MTAGSPSLGTKQRLLRVVSRCESVDDFVGVFGGVDYFVSPNVFFSGEAHLFDETSIYLGVGYRF